MSKETLANFEHLANHQRYTRTVPDTQIRFRYNTYNVCVMLHCDTVFHRRSVSDVGVNGTITVKSRI